MSTKTTISVMKVEGRLVPTDWFQKELMDKLPADKEMLISITRPRNPKHHRKLFALLNIVCQSTAYEGDVDSLLDELKYATRKVRFVTDLSGTTHMIPASISFGSMDQGHFERWYDRAVNVICSVILPEMDEAALREEVENIVNGKA